jgi:hypothetical protein
MEEEEINNKDGILRQKAKGQKDRALASVAAPYFLFSP